jgi:ubiquinone/menaquinone biosynthesis C-methylase UbiE
MVQHILSSPITTAQDEPEFARQRQLTHLLIKAMGGSLPSTQLDPTQVQTALDVACGSGGWVLDMAKAHPAIQVTGLDTCEAALASAQRQAQTEDLKNAHFGVQDLHTLDTTCFPATSFDLINLMILAPALLTLDYQLLVQRLVALCRPGGLLRWTEMEFPLTSSPAFEQLVRLTLHALQQVGHSFIPLSLQAIAEVFDEWRREEGKPVVPVHRRHLGITPLMGQWLRKARYQHIRHFPTAIEVSTGTPAHAHFLRQVEVYTQQIMPFLFAQGVITEADSASLLTQIREELQQERFCGLCMMLTVCAQAPASSHGW